MNINQNEKPTRNEAARDAQWDLSIPALARKWAHVTCDDPFCQHYPAPHSHVR